MAIELLVGRIGRPHGLRGDLTIDVRTDHPETRFAVGARVVARRGGATGSAAGAATGAAAEQRVLTVASSRWHQSRLLCTFAEVADRTAAEAARGLQLFVTIEGDEPSDPDEFYDHELIGLAVVDLSGQHLGEVTALTPGAAQDLLTVRTPDGREALVPFVTALVPEIDLAGRRVVVADRPGLITPFPEGT